MRAVFQVELAEVQDRLVDIAELVLSAIRHATLALETADIELAEKVIGDDPQIDDMATGLDELVIQILARQAPVARDLRVAVSALRISANLERMGDLARHVAELARRRFPSRVAPDQLRDTFTRMASEDIRAAEALVRLLRTADLAVADELIASDTTIDKLHRSVFDTVTAQGWDEAAEQTVDATLASRYLERFGDQAVSVARKIVYLDTGEWNQHEPTLGRSSAS